MSEADNIWAKISAADIDKNNSVSNVELHNHLERMGHAERATLKTELNLLGVLGKEITKDLITANLSNKAPLTITFYAGCEDGQDFSQTAILRAELRAGKETIEQLLPTVRSVQIMAQKESDQKNIPQEEVIWNNLSKADKSPQDNSISAEEMEKHFEGLDPLTAAKLRTQLTFMGFTTNAITKESVKTALSEPVIPGRPIVYIIDGAQGRKDINATLPNEFVARYNTNGDAVTTKAEILAGIDVAQNRVQGMYDKFQPQDPKTMPNANPQEQQRN